MVNGPLLIAILGVAVVFIVVATTRFRVHPFLALLIAAYGMGLGSGLSPEKTVAAITGGFGKTVGYIGIVIACGSIIGVVLEKSGCARVMAESIIRLIGKSRSVLAMSCTGAAVSVPVFCDSGFVVLSPLIRSLARQTGTSLATYAVALSMGLYATHVLVPPTPGPIAAAGELGADIGMVIVLGLLVSIPIVATTYVYATLAGRRVFLDPGVLDTDEIPAPAGEVSHGAVAAFAPIFVPVFLIAIKSLAELPAAPFGAGYLKTFAVMVGDPNTALILGVFIAWWVVRRNGFAVFGGWSGDGLRVAGTIILITAAGGAFGGVLRETPMARLLGESLSSMDLGGLRILLPFLVAASLKTAIGSSTVAIITTASLFSPLLLPLGLSEGLGPVLTTMAIGVGSMMVSHVNDSFFWVITQMSGMSVAQGYRLVTAASAVAGLTGITVVLVLSLLLA